MGIDVVQPSVNRSQREFTAHGGQVVFGLGGIKNVGDEAIREIVEARKEGGDYISLLDLCCRVNLRKVTKRVLESLIKGGACDCFNVSRAGYAGRPGNCSGGPRPEKAKDKSSNQVSLLAMAPVVEAAPQPGVGLDCPDATLPEMEDDLKLRAEKKPWASSLTSHPLQPYSREIRCAAPDHAGGRARALPRRGNYLRGAGDHHQGSAHQVQGRAHGLCGRGGSHRPRGSDLFPPLLCRGPRTDPGRAAPLPYGPPGQPGRRRPGCG